MPEILQNNGIYTHLVSDHHHYWEDGGATYHTRYNTWEISRGQSGDPWKGNIQDPEIPEIIGYRSGRMLRQHWINQKYMPREQDLPQAKTFSKGIEFIKQNHKNNNWFLQIETFDPHEPYFIPKKWKDLYSHKYQGPHFDWPSYQRVKESSEQIRHCRLQYAALISMCDHYLGKILDLMDDLKLWKDTMLIINTDHGFLLGEHDWWGKCVQPFYNEIAHIPFFIWDPSSGKKNERCHCLAQTIDIAPTLIDFFNIKHPKDMQGKSLKETITSNKPIRKTGLFGIHGGHVNCTDGRYVYMRGPKNPDNKPLYNYTLMPTHLRRLFSVEELKQMKLSPPFSFTKGCQLMKIPKQPWVNQYPFGTMLFDLNNDPQQEKPIKNIKLEKMMIKHMKKLMKESDAPPEQFERLDLS
jgi:arylsulfatase A-like enzyme